MRRHDSAPLLAIYLEPSGLLLYRAFRAPPSAPPAAAAPSSAAAGAAAAAGAVRFVRVSHGLRALLPKVAEEDLWHEEQSASEGAGARAALSAFEAASRLSPLGPRPSRLMSLERFGGVDHALDGTSSPDLSRSARSPVIR